MRPSGRGKRGSMKDWKERVEGDYSNVRGVCHNPEKGKSRADWDRELGYAARLNLNAVRFWMEQEEWEKDPDGYEKRILDFVDCCGAHGIRVMPIFWNGNIIREYEEANEAQWERKERYAARLIRLMKGNPAVLMWDVYNEPFCNDYLHHAPEGELEERKGKLARDRRKHCELIRRRDEDTPITVGHELAEHIGSTADLVDVISFHDYLPTRRRMEEAYRKAYAAAKEQGGKPVLNTETGCLGRANPYEAELALCEKYRCGFFLFNLIIEGFWGEIHGLVYPDGTIRDPGIVAALYGFYRKDDPDRIVPDGNREGHAYKAAAAVEQALRLEDQTLFVSRAKSDEEILEAAEYCINILEPCGLVPMQDSLSARLAAFRQQPPEERKKREIRAFAYECAARVKEAFQIL